MLLLSKDNICRGLLIRLKQNDQPTNEVWKVIKPVLASAWHICHGSTHKLIFPDEMQNYSIWDKI